MLVQKDLRGQAVKRMFANHTFPAQPDQADVRVHPAGGGAAALRAVRHPAGRTQDTPPPTHPRLGGVPAGGTGGKIKYIRVE